MTDPVLWRGWALSKIKASTTLGDEARGQKRLKRRRKNQNSTLDILKTEARHLYEGEKHATFASTELVAFIAKLKEGASNQDYRDRHNFLVKGLAKGVRELSWDVQVPSQIHVHHASTSPISARGQRQGSSYRSLLDIANSHFGATKSECVAGKKARSSALKIQRLGN